MNEIRATLRADTKAVGHFDAHRHKKRKARTHTHTHTRHSISNDGSKFLGSRLLNSTLKPSKSSFHTSPALAKASSVISSLKHMSKRTTKKS